MLKVKRIKMKSVDIIDDHPCPVCGHKIGMHTNSSFGHNPRIDNVSTGETAPECNRSYNSLLIEKLVAWWNDAINERDVYVESYNGACKERDAWQNTATVLSVKLKKAVGALRYYAEPPNEDEYNQGPAIDTLVEIEGE
jgi:hypothetical protein